MVQVTSTVKVEEKASFYLLIKCLNSKKISLLRQRKSEEKKPTVSPLGGFVAQATNRDLVKEKQEQLSKPKEEKVASEDVKPVEVKEHIAPFGSVVVQHSERFS